jgi:hypothetical protein
MGVIEQEVVDKVHAEEELSRALGEHVGEWVAVKEHRILAYAETLHDLIAQLRAMPSPEIDGIFQVVEERGAASFF